MAEKQDFDRLSELLPGAAQAPPSSAAPVDPGLSGRSAALGAAAGGVAGTAAGSGEGDLNQRLAAVWPEVVGEEVAGNARPVQLRDGRLVVTTSSSAWAQTLQLMSEMIRARLNECLGGVVVDKAVFRHAGWEEFPAAGHSGHAAPRRRAAAKRAAPAALAGAGATAGSPPASAASPPAGTSPAGTMAPLPAPLSPSPPVPAAPAQAAADPEGFSDEERRALDDLDRLPLAPSVKAAVREAMRAGFVRAKQDFDR